MSYKESKTSRIEERNSKRYVSKEKLEVAILIRFRIMKPSLSQKKDQTCTAKMRFVTI